MVPFITKGGENFRRAWLYFCHDKQASTSSRVGWIELRNLMTDCPKEAWQLMEYTYKKAFKAKVEAAPRFNSNNLYQITAYLRNAQREKGWANVEGILLYPAVDQNFHHDFLIDSYRLQITSIDLNRDWKHIHQHLLSLIQKG